MSKQDLLFSFLNAQNSVLQDIESRCVDTKVSSFRVPAEEFSARRRFRVVTKPVQKKKRYSVVVFDEDVAAGRNGSQSAPLDEPGYVFLAKNDLPLSKAAVFHRQAVAYFSEQGF